MGWPGRNDAVRPSSLLQRRECIVVSAEEAFGLGVDCVGDRKGLAFIDSPQGQCICALNGMFLYSTAGVPL